MRRLIQFALLAVCLIVAATVAQAQRLDGSLRVTVTDKSGGTVQDARVTVTNQATNVSVTANASSAGTIPSTLDAASTADSALSTNFMTSAPPG